MNKMNLNENYEWFYFFFTLIFQFTKQLPSNFSPEDILNISNFE